ncbi:MAG: protein kinase [Sandaracinaceae bacterium]|nr:protein kinase [Sandaracinaceae bacterium]
MRVIDFGETPEGLLFLAMEYLEGRTLSQAIRDRELGVQDAVDITAQILSSLKEAHDKGVIHRDLKPDNIFLTEDPASDEPLVKVLDFGIAKIVGGDISVDALETQAGTVFGTPSTCRQSRRRGTNWTVAATSTPWARCSTPCSRARRPSTTPTPWWSWRSTSARCPSRRGSACPARPSRRPSTAWS